MSTCSADKIVAALHEQSQLITDFVYEEIKTSDRFALRMVPDGGVVARDSNQESIIYGEGFQAPVAYESTNHAARALVDGEMSARTLAGQNGILQTHINSVDDNACNRGRVTIDFAQGFRKRGTVDYELEIDTPVKCARDLERLGVDHVKGYYRGFYNQFTRFGLDNFSDNLLNLIIQKSEANASIVAGDHFSVTTGGWQAPPLYGLSIHFLQDYRRYMMGQMKSLGLSVPSDWMLEIEAPVEDWITAVRKDQEVRNGTTTGTNYNTEWLKDDEGPLRGRKFGVYGGIKCYFNESPIRGYYVKTGTVGGNDVYRFVRVLEYINEVGEEGGVVARYNHQYDEDTIVVDGVAHPMVTLIPHVDPRSFERYGLLKPVKPYGEDNMGVNFDTRVVDGAFLACNEANDKFKIYARHEFRFKSMYPEVSGFIAYLHARRAGYVIDVTRRNYGSGPDKFASPEQFRQMGTTECQSLECAECDKVTGADGSCIEVGGGGTGTVGLIPAGAVTVAFLGEAFTLKIGVERGGDTSDACSVAYATADVSGSSDAITATSGTLEWAANDNSTKYIEIPVLATADDNDSFSLTLSGAVGATIVTGASVTTVTINDLNA